MVYSEDIYIVYHTFKVLRFQGKEKNVPNFLLLYFPIKTCLFIFHMVLKGFSVLLYIYFACLSVCLYPINVKTAEPIGPKFFMGHHVTTGKVYEQKLENRKWARSALKPQCNINIKHKLTINILINILITAFIYII